MKTNIFSFIATALLTLTAVGCNDNYNTELEPIKTDRNLKIQVESDRYSGQTLSLDAGASNTTVKVTSNTRWAVEVTDEGGWCTVDVFNGAGDGQFTISVLENMKEDRQATVTVSMMIMENGSWVSQSAGSQNIIIKQVASQVRLTPSSIEPFAADNPKSQEFQVSANDVAWTLSLTYDGADATEFVTVTNMINMEQTGDNTFGGYGNASFSIILQSNRTAANRIAFLTLSSVVGTYSVEISQLKSDYTFDVTPTENQVVQPEGGTINFGVLTNDGWTVTSSADWISFQPSTGAGTGGREETTAIVAPNTSGLQRTAEVRFISDDSRYPSLSVTVIQRGFDIEFSASPVETLGVFMPERQTCEFNLDSRFNWQLILPDWISADAVEGAPSDTEQRIRLTIDANATGVNRNGTVTIKPLPTEFGGVVELNPAALNIDDKKFTITQFGGREPAISTPWLVEGYTQTTATIEFNFYSPYYPVTEAGLQWRKVGDTEWTTYTEKIDNLTEGTVSAALTQLDPATKYEARGYVVYSDNQRKDGEISFPFTTAGQRPGGNDNPTPGL